MKDFEETYTKILYENEVLTIFLEEENKEEESKENKEEETKIDDENIYSNREKQTNSNHNSSEKLFSTITYNDETVTYSDLIRKQSENLVSALLYGEKFIGFYLRW